MSNNKKLIMFLGIVIFFALVASLVVGYKPTIDYEVLDGRDYYDTFDRWNTPEQAIYGIDAALNKQSEGYITRRAESVVSLIALSSKLNRLELASQVVLDDKDRIEIIYIIETEKTQGALDQLTEHLNDDFITPFNETYDKSFKVEDISVDHLLEEFETYSLLLENTVYPIKK